ncbi:[FeFe] hydrogenase H-cluster radical SAM maturase HydE [Herbivorax sp. ANBcel31]|uniref:[FeFe] hydrogenase H-cluster radical SAM maturase HydE n=1 Tax=Herbivorax sp. ANBcel31 TaxID=3069754 RepID=UPI0027B37B3A|nr:[FeFe] hydrogenase H-cluster radical SAM maturase HydE [Herbivorax sp. ANBcel31]MDQ2086257.1 [FeFe] hydrogenase H-cluster radical SAM maturase HydE [Herbivorax sp. ANBcel31]
MKDKREFEIFVNTLEKEGELGKVSLAKILTSEKTDSLYSAADRVRKKFVGDGVHLRGLIEFSSYCGNNCFYCGLRAANSKVKRYRMQPDEIIQCAAHAVKFGLKTVVLQSGEDKSFGVNELCKIVNRIKSMDVAVTLSIGELSRNEYSLLKNAGADRYLLRIETSNKKLYEKLHPGMSHENRLRCLYNLKELGYETGTGCLIGLPGQTIEMLAEDLLLFKKLGVDMIGIGPFIPCRGTPLEYEKGGNVETVLKMMALARLLMRDINMPATTALSIKDSDGHRKGLCCGANVVMPNMGRTEYKKLYKIYPGKGEGLINSKNHVDDIKSKIISLGRKIGQGYGNRNKI